MFSDTKFLQAQAILLLLQQQEVEDAENDGDAGIPSVLIRPVTCRPPPKSKLDKARSIAQYVARFGALPLSVRDTDIGRGVFADRDIHCGEFLFGERPVAKAKANGSCFGDTLALTPTPA